MLDAIAYVLENTGPVTAALLLAVAVLWYLDLRKIDRLKRELAERPPPPGDGLPADVAASTSAMIVNLMPEIVKLPASEMHARLTRYVETAIHACREFVHTGFPPPEPSEN